MQKDAESRRGPPDPLRGRGRPAMTVAGRRRSFPRGIVVQRGQRRRAHDGFGCGERGHRPRRRHGRGEPDRGVSGVAWRAVLRTAATARGAAGRRLACRPPGGDVRRSRMGRSVHFEPDRRACVWAGGYAPRSARLRRLGALFHRHRPLRFGRAAGRIWLAGQARPAGPGSDPGAGFVRSGGERGGEGAETARLRRWPKSSAWALRSRGRWRGSTSS